MGIGSPLGRTGTVIIYKRDNMGRYYRNPKNRGKKVELSLDNDQDFIRFNIKTSFKGVDKCLDNYDDIARGDVGGWHQCRCWKDATKRKRQWFRHVVR